MATRRLKGMIHGKLDILATDPPIDTWTALTLTNLARKLLAARMGAIEIFTCQHNALSSIPYQDMQSLRELYVGDCEFVSLDLWQLPNLRYCTCDHNGWLQSIDAHGHTQLRQLNSSNCLHLSSVSVAGCTGIESLLFNGCALPTAAVDQVLADLATAGTSEGNVDLSGDPNEAPSAAGLASRTVLASRGWTVTTK